MVIYGTISLMITSTAISLDQDGKIIMYQFMIDDLGTITVTKDNVFYGQISDFERDKIIRFDSEEDNERSAKEYDQL